MSISKTTFEETSPPFYLQILVGITGVLDRLGVSLVNIDIDNVKAAVEKKTGLTNWGNPQFYNDWKTHADFVNRNKGLNLTGKIAIRNDYTRHLTNYLLLQDAIKRHPDMITQPITRPIIITGLPRTGTTLLQRMLSQDPASRGPALWELFNPVVVDTPPDAATKFQTRSESFVKMVKNNSVPLWSIHPMLSNEADECTFILPHHLGDLAIHAGMEYFDWYMKRDATPDYELHKQYLQSLQYKKTPQRRWVLKSPIHLPKLEALLKVYPDACIVFCHRSMTHVMASWFSYMATSKKFVAKNVDPKEVARNWLRIWKESMDIAMDVRAKFKPEQFFDVAYDDLVENPVKIAKEIYAHFDLPWSLTGERAMQQWLDNDRKTQKVGHRYTLQQFGMNEQTLMDTYKTYMEKYNVPVD